MISLDYIQILLLNYQEVLWQYNEDMGGSVTVLQMDHECLVTYIP